MKKATRALEAFFEALEEGDEYYLDVGYGTLVLQYDRWLGGFVPVAFTDTDIDNYLPGVTPITDDADTVLDAARYLAGFPGGVPLTVDLNHETVPLPLNGSVKLNMPGDDNED